MSIVYLYRQAGALGVATHYARNSISASRPDLEFLGLGHLHRGWHNAFTGEMPAYITGAVACLKFEDMEAVS